MKGEKLGNGSIDLSIPPKDDVEAWQKFAEMVKDSAKDLMQDGCEASTFGDCFLGKFVDDVDLVQRLQQQNIPDAIIDAQIKSTKKSYEDFATANHETIEELRNSLESLSPNDKRRQNKIFTNIMDNDQTNSPFIYNAVKPRVLYEASKMSSNFTLLLALRGEEPNLYDFISRLTERDEMGAPVLSDLTVKNFFEWYQSSLAKLQKELNAKSPQLIKEYEHSVNCAVKEGLLPRAFLDNLSLLKDELGDNPNLHFSIFDFYDPRFSRFSGTFTNTLDRLKSPIALRADIATSQDRYYGVVWHELTHAISGSKMNFYNLEATRIFDEAMAEHITHLARAGEDPEEFEPEKLAFMTGYTYPVERSVIADIAKNGEKPIDPKLFYLAYVEFDRYCDPKHIQNSNNYYSDNEHEEELVLMNDPAKEALFQALFEAYPECKTEADLGDLIVKRFEERKKAGAALGKLFSS